MHNFDIYFSGKLLPEADPAQVRDAVGKRFRIEGKALERLFQGEPVRIKKAVDVETAGQFRTMFRNMGALVDIVPAGTPPRPAPAGKPDTTPPARPEPASAPAAAATQESTPEQAAQPASLEAAMELLPARTGSLEDCAVQQVAQPIPDTDWMPLDQTGVDLDQSPPPPTPDIDTSELGMGGANSGTLEDCHQDIAPVEIGDISWMQVGEAGGVLDDTPPPPEPRIDTSELEMLPSHTSLEDVSGRPPAPPPPDTSGLKLEGE